MLKKIILRKTIIKYFAEELANLQKSADTWYYIKHDQNQSSYVLDVATGIIRLARKMGILNEIYEEAYKIYDFRNSGKTGYTLKDGKIVIDSDSKDIATSIDGITWTAEKLPGDIDLTKVHYQDGTYALMPNDDNDYREKK